MDEKWKKGAWDSHEDELLRQGVEEYGYRWAGLVKMVRRSMLILGGNSWTDISRTVKTRSPDRGCPSYCASAIYSNGRLTLTSECAKHWRNSLNPDNSRSEWTGEEVSRQFAVSYNVGN